MVTVWEILRKTKVKLVAIVGTIGTSGMAIFGLVSSSEGIKAGESFTIVWAMGWPYLILLVLVAAILSNAPPLWKWCIGACRSVGGYWYAVRGGLPPKRRLALVLASGAAGLASLALTALLLWNCFLIAEGQAEYVLRLASRDFRNRQMILARQYLEGYQLRDAARVYGNVSERFQDEVAGTRLKEIEQRYRTYSLLSGMSAERERRLGTSPENAFRETAMYLLSPFEPDANVRLTSYVERYTEVLAAKARLDGVCSGGSAGSGPTKARRDLALLVEPEFIKLAGDRPARWYCATARKGLNEQVLAARWRIADLQRLLDLRHAAETRDVVCPGAVDANALTSTSDVVPRSDERTERDATETDRGNAIGNEVSPYARGQYSCPPPATDVSRVRQLLQYMAPGLDRS